MTRFSPTFKTGIDQAAAEAMSTYSSGAAQAIELTLVSQCSPINNGRTIEFSNNPVANPADINQRMAFVFKAAAQFDKLLHSTERHQIEQALEDIAIGQDVQ